MKIMKTGGDDSTVRLLCLLGVHWENVTFYSIIVESEREVAKVPTSPSQWWWQYGKDIPSCTHNLKETYIWAPHRLATCKEFVYHGLSHRAHKTLSNNKFLERNPEGWRTPDNSKRIAVRESGNGTTVHTCTSCLAVVGFKQEGDWWRHADWPKRWRCGKDWAVPRPNER